jgi:beta-1,4-glucosyltransferase
MTQKPTQTMIAGFTIRRTTAAAAFRFLKQRWRRRRRTIVFFANANFVIQCAPLRQTIAESPEILLLNDGVALDIAALLRRGIGFPENLNGTDFTPAFLAALDRAARVYLVGGRPEVVRTAADVLSRRYPQVEICGQVDGYSIWGDEAAAIREINAAGPDVLLVAFGNPLQEKWILQHREALEVPLIFAVGALFDFLSGTAPRAPQYIRRVRLEWAYRLAHEPRRLLRRYTIDMLKFFGMAIFDSNKT